MEAQPHRQALDRWERLNLGVSLCIFILIPVAGLAGGLAMAPLIAILGLVAYLTGAGPVPRSLSYWSIALFVFLIWATLTTLWSPYPEEGWPVNPFKIILGTFLYLGAVKGLRRTTDHRPSLMGHGVIAMTVTLAGLLLIELLTGYGLSFMADPPQEGESLLRKQGDAEMNVGHGLTLLVLILPITVVHIMQSMRLGWAVAAIVVFGSFIITVLGGLAIGQVAVIGGIIGVVLTYFWPRSGLKLMIALAMASIIFAPLISIICANLTAAHKAAMPFSWEHRVEMWAYTGQRIIEAPVFGHGFDAVRTFSDTFDTRGFTDISVVSLHPHNAGLHIWVETGLVGAVLATLAIWFIGRRALRISRGVPLLASAMGGTLVSATLLCATTYGVWQEWWWACLIFAVGLLQTIRSKP